MLKAWCWRRCDIERIGNGQEASTAAGVGGIDAPAVYIACAQLNEDAALHIVAAIRLHEYGLYAIDEEERTVKERTILRGVVPQRGVGEVALCHGRVGGGV